MANRLQFRSKDEIFTHKSVIEGLDSQPIANQVKPSLQAVPEREGKHAYEAPYGRLHAPALDGFEHYFCVGMPLPLVPRSELSPNLLEVINFTIEYDCVTAGD